MGIKSKEPIDVLLSTSTYQTLLANKIAADLNTKTHLIILPSFENEGLFKSLTSLERVSFDTMETLPVRNPNTQWNKWTADFYSVVYSYLQCWSKDIQDVYATHSRPAVQVLLEKSSGEGICIEDGLGTYLPKESKRDQTTTKYILSNLVYGPCWSGRYEHGDHPKFNRLKATSPKFVDDSFNSHKKERINSEGVDKILDTWSKSYFTKQEQKKYKRCECLVLLPHSRAIERRKGVDCTQINNYIEQTDNVAVKYHPREETNYVSGESYTKIPQNIPAEFLYTDNFGIKEVYGGLSTTLLSAKWISDDTDVYSFIKPTNDRYQNISLLFDHLNIQTTSKIKVGSA